MPGFIEGLATGVDPYVKGLAQVQFEKLKRQQQLQETLGLMDRFGLTNALQRLAEPQAAMQPQALSDFVEQQVATPRPQGGVGIPGTTTDLTSAFEQRGLQQNQAQDLLRALHLAGLKFGEGQVAAQPAAPDLFSMMLMQQMLGQGGQGTSGMSNVLSGMGFGGRFTPQSGTPPAPVPPSSLASTTPSQEGAPSQLTPSITLGKGGASVHLTGRPSAETIGSEAAAKAIATERAKASANIPSAIRDIAVLNKQFNEAFPPTPGTQNTPAYQRAIGVAKSFGAKLGIGVTPKQTAVLKALPLAGIGLVRLAGALGRVTNIELQMAEQTMNQQGLTPDERFEVARTLATQYMARISPDEWRILLKSNPDLPQILKDYSIETPQLTGQSQVPTQHSPLIQTMEAQGYKFKGVKSR